MVVLKIISVLFCIGLLQACSNTPRILNYGDRLKVVGGSESQSRDAAFVECKKSNPLFFEIDMVNEHFNVEGRVRDFKCKFWDQNNELERPTSLQQRVLQTRKFNKSDVELQNALNAWIAHSGGSGVVLKDPPVIENNKVTYPSSGTLRVNFGKNLQPILYVTGRYSSAGENSVHLRIRTFAGETEVFSPKLYQLIFNKIAEEQFTQAIKIDPVEVQ